jgi:hypothetical protein
MNPTHEQARQIFHLAKYYYIHYTSKDWVNITAIDIMQRPNINEGLEVIALKQYIKQIISDWNHAFNLANPNEPKAWTIENGYRFPDITEGKTKVY